MEARWASSRIKSIVVRGEPVRDDHAIADAFNYYFSSVATGLDKDIPIINDSPLKYISHVNRPNSFYLTPVTGTQCAQIPEKILCSVSWSSNCTN